MAGAELFRVLGKCILHAAALSLLLVASAHAADQPVWVEALGESAQGEMDTLKEVKERARNDAKVKAIEQARGTFIKAHTVVSNSQVSEDLAFAAVRGEIEKFEVLGEGRDVQDPNRYIVRIKALVKPVLPEKGEGFSLDVHLSKSELHEGEDVVIGYKAGIDCYVYIFVVASDGSVTVLLPNEHETDNHVKANRTYLFPPKGSPLRLTAQFLPGCKDKVVEEKVKVIATKQRSELLPLGFKEGVFTVYDGTATGMIDDLLRRLNRLEPTAWQQATEVYRIRR